jgi:hypothetical protein
MDDCSWLEGTAVWGPIDEFSPRFDVRIRISIIDRVCTQANCWLVLV